MEVILLQMFDPIINWGMSSFNPCFYGSYSFTSSLYVTAFFPNSVLILVFMEVILLPFIAVSISSFLAAF